MTEEPEHEKAAGTILVVDDNPRNLYLLEVLLRGAGYTTVSANNGSEALAQLHARRVDGIVSDILMPVMDGFTLIRECKKHPVLRDIPFIFYTATYTEKNDEEFGLSLGAVRYIVKPMEPDELLRQIREAMAEGAGRDGQARPFPDDATFSREYSRRVGAKLDKKTRQLAESEEKFRTVVENIPDIILVHRAGTIVFVNNAVTHLTGFRPDEVVGQPLSRFIAPESREIVEDAIRRRKSGGQVALYEVGVLTKSGARIAIMIRGLEIEFQGTPASLKVLTDITERKRKDDQIRLANRKLALMRDVTYQDIKNKVTALRGFLELARKAKTAGEHDAYVEKEERVLASIHSLIESTKDYQHMGEDQSRWIPVERAARMQFASLSRKEDITFDCDLRGLEVYCDPLFDRVIFNLLQNTVRHGQTAHRISLTCRETPAGLVLSVEDDGTGIPDESRARIFERTVGSPGKFGLFFVREFLEISGMGIAETGTYGSGARFEITVPKGMYRFAGSES